MMKIPKIIFRYSWLYDERINEEIDPQKCRDYLKKIKLEWEDHSDKILQKLTQITGLVWAENEIIIYIVSRGIPYSDPLTINTKHTPDYNIDVITHELIHRLWVYGDKKNKIYNHFKEKYPDFSDHIMVHIPLFAILQELLTDLFGEERAKRDRDFFKNITDYDKAYKIVENEGYKNITKKIRELTK